MADGDSTVNGPSKPPENTFSSINDVIESVVNAARNHSSEDSRDSTSSSSDTKSIGTYVSMLYFCVRVSSFSLFCTFSCKRYPRSTIFPDSRTSYETEKESHTDETAAPELTTALPNISNAAANEQVKLPDNLNSEVLELISQIKRSTINAENMGARMLFKFSESEFTSKLLK